MNFLDNYPDYKIFRFTEISWTIYHAMASKIIVAITTVIVITVGQITVGQITVGQITV